MREKRAFLAFAVAPVAVTVALGVSRLPPTWQQAVILFLFVGVPTMIFALRILGHAKEVELARLARTPQAAPSRVGRPVVAHDDELRVVSASNRAAQVRL